MASMSKVILIGNLGRDAELKVLPGGATVLEFTVATNEKWTDRQGGAQEHTQWFRVSLWGKAADSLKQYLTKGKQVYVDGKLRVRDYTDAQGQKKVSLDVRADQVTLLGGRGGGEGGGGGVPAEMQGQDEISDDDIPF